MLTNTNSILDKLKLRVLAQHNLGSDEKVFKGSQDYDGSLSNLYFDIEQLNKLWVIEDEKILRSNRRFIGPVITFVKRCVRKILRWYVHPIAEQQTVFNSYNVKMINQLKCYLERLNLEQLDGQVNAINSQMHAINSQFHTFENETTKSVIQYFERFSELHEENFIKAITEIKKDYECTLSEIRDEYDNMVMGLKKDNEAIKQAATIEIESLKVMIKTENKDLYTMLKNELIEYETDEEKRIHHVFDLIKVTKDSNAIERAIECMSKPLNTLGKEKLKVVIICERYSFDGSFDAIKKEAFSIYSILKDSDKYEPVFLSIENEIEGVFERDGIYYVNRNQFTTYIGEINAYLIHLFSSNAHLLFDETMMVIQTDRIIFHCTGQEPFTDLPEWAVEELQHLADNNRIHVIVESQYAYDKFIQTGIYNTSLMRPIPQILKRSERIRQQDKLVIGFASSPRTKEQFNNRGIAILENLVKAFSDNITLLIAWRDEGVEVSKCLKESKNVIIKYGQLDMNEFYSSIDLLIIPYVQREDNHACSLSAMEALILGIPVIATRVAGISEILSKVDSKCIAETNWESCLNQIHYIFENYDEVSDKFIRYELEDRNPLMEIETVYNSLSRSKMISLSEWKWALTSHDKYLVKGNESIKSYYENQKIAAKYDADRFIDYPMSVVNRIEQFLVKQLLMKYRTAENLEIIDIATGTGRILDAVYGIGNCTVVDNSVEMLKIILDRYGSSDELGILKGDFFNIDIQYKYDVVTTFRYIRHFEADERDYLMRKINRITNKGGILIFDVPNLEAELSLREKIGWQHFNIYDVFWNKDSIKSELKRYGYDLLELSPIDGYLFKEYIGDYRDRPISWVACAQKIEDVF